MRKNYSYAKHKSHSLLHITIITRNPAYVNAVYSVLCCLVQALAAGLQNDIPAMVNYLLKLGLEVNVNMEDLTNKEGLLC